MNVIDLLGIRDQKNAEEVQNKIKDAYEKINKTCTSEITLINDEYIQNLKKEFEIVNDFVSKATIHREFLRSLINFDQKPKMTLVNAIVFVLENEKIELHRDEIYEKIKPLNLSKPYIEKNVFASTLGYLKKVNRITNGEKRGYWKLREEKH